MSQWIVYFFCANVLNFYFKRWKTNP